MIVFYFWLAYRNVSLSGSCNYFSPIWEV